MITPELYPLCAAGVTLACFLVLLAWLNRREKARKAAAEWPEGDY